MDTKIAWHDIFEIKIAADHEAVQNHNIRVAKRGGNIVIFWPQQIQLNNQNKMKSIEWRTKQTTIPPDVKSISWLIALNGFTDLAVNYLNWTIPLEWNSYLTIQYNKRRNVIEFLQV